MKLYYVNHDCRFAVEQMMLTLFPGERPEYPETPPGPEDSAATVTVTWPEGRVRAETVLLRGGGRWTGERTAPVTGDMDELERRRVLQHTVRLSFYDAGVACLGAEPPWGALTGVRPVKLPTRDLLSGMTREQAGAHLRDYYRVSPKRAELALDCAQATLAAKASLESDEVSVYVGIPFCPTRCAYCSFISADVKGSAKLVGPYVDALCREIEAAGSALASAGRKVRTIYMGGGTPTTLSAAQLERVMGALADGMDLSRCSEYTVEAGRPDTITPEKLAVIRRMGGTRVSVNPQTMRDPVLRAMGRAHTAEDIRRAWALVRDCGIPVANMDLIAGLPQDDLDGFRATVDEVLDMGAANITVHTLALKKSAALFQARPQLPDGAAVAAMLGYAWTALAARGYVPYYLYRQKYMSGSFENVGWCLPGTENLYNICMMEELHPVISLGAGGVTKLTGGDGRLQRLCNPKYPADYLAALDRVLADKDRAGEYLRANAAD